MNISGEVVVADNVVDGRFTKDRRVTWRTRCGRIPQKAMAAPIGPALQPAAPIYRDRRFQTILYDLLDLPRFVEPLQQGIEFVMGNRFLGNIEKGAMPWHHRSYIGNPLLSGLLNLMFHSPVSDAHCGMRSFTREAYERMHLQTTGMEFASEMVIKSAQLGLKTCEIPITLHRDGRKRPPHLRSFRDGWRHLRFMLLDSPTWLFLIPGAFLFIFGVLVLFGGFFSPVRVLGLRQSLNILIFSSLSTLMGYQVILLGIFDRIYAVTHEFRPLTSGLHRAFGLFNLERGLLAGIIFLLIGAAISLSIAFRWIRIEPGSMFEIRLVLVASTMILLGLQTIFSSFYLSILGIDRRLPNN